jgi:glycosyltransferase involved in cell wall biosynthesis
MTADHRDDPAIVARAESAAGAELERLRADLAATQAALTAAERAASEFRDEADQLRVALDVIQGSLAWRVLSRVRSMRDQAAPPGTLRRRAYDLALAAVRSGGGRLSPARAGAGSDIASAQQVLRALAEFERTVTVSKARTIVAIASATGLVESEGQRPTQLALQLACRGIPVVFLAFRWTRDPWRAPERAREGILEVPLDLVTDRPDVLLARFADKERIALFTFPHPSLFETVAAANAEGWTTAYDVLDDWEEFHRVGQASWWDEAFERHLATTCDAVFAVNEMLSDRIRDATGRVPEVNGNGLRPELTQVDVARPLERGDVTVGYFGYLAGAWFDWELVAAAAAARPRWRFYLIGYGGTPAGVRLPGNVALLGRKPYHELASWAQGWDVAMIPFKPERLALGADPIKTYEYLALGLPVVATGVRAPPGAEDLVDRAEGVDAFLAALQRGAATRASGAEKRRAYAAANTWSARVDALLASLQQGRQGVGVKRRLLRGAG